MDFCDNVSIPIGSITIYKCGGISYIILTEFANLIGYKGGS
jgi:hypothetical protein